MGINVMIVEDEKAARDRIAQFDLWNRETYTLAGLAADGLIALERIEEINPQILITDIEMPRINGLELIEQLKERNWNIPIIILSCHESFEYARRAVSLGVKEYLIKDFLSQDQLELTLAKVTPPPIKNNKGEGSFSSFTDRDILSPLLKEDGLKNQTDTPLPFNKLEKLILMGISFEGDHFSQQRIGYLKNQIQLSQEKDPGLLSHWHGGTFFLLKPFSDKKMTAPSMGNQLFQGLTKETGDKVIALSDPFEKRDQIPQARKQVEDLIRHKIILGINRIILPQSIECLIVPDPQRLESKLHKIRHTIMREEVEDFSFQLSDIYSNLLPGMVQYRFVEMVNSKILSYFYLLMENKGLISTEITEEKIPLPQKLAEFETLDKIQIYLIHLFRKIISEGMQKRIFTNNPKLKKILDLIHSQYTEDLTLEYVADEVGIHKVYLSRMFKKETGTNYYEYLQNLRIKEACTLLKNDTIKISQVAHLCGFRNYDQFSVIFKKMKGCTPGQYRKS